MHAFLCASIGPMMQATGKQNVQVNLKLKLVESTNTFSV